MKAENWITPQAPIPPKLAERSGRPHLQQKNITLE